VPVGFESEPIRNERSSSICGEHSCRPIRTSVTFRLDTRESRLTQYEETHRNTSIDLGPKIRDDPSGSWTFYACCSALDESREDESVDVGCESHGDEEEHNDESL